MIHRNIITFATVLLICCFTLPAGAADLPPTDAAYYDQLGQKHYDAGNYEVAVNAWSEAVRLEPDNSHYHHVLAKAYGQLADKSEWFRAVKLSAKIREGLERAVELDNENIDALQDLKKYYEQAPAFLGGGEEKAENIQKQLDKLTSSNRA